MFHVRAGPPAVGALSVSKTPNTSPNSQFKRGATWNPFRTGAPARCVARLRHIALARKPSLDASGLLLWARATS